MSTVAQRSGEIFDWAVGWGSHDLASQRFHPHPSPLPSEEMGYPNALLSRVIGLFEWVERYSTTLELERIEIG